MVECWMWQAPCILSQDIQLKKIVFLKHGMKQVSKKRE